jgi:acetyl-CoA carboxylase biotin carboxyl carrier protein
MSVRANDRTRVSHAPAFAPQALRRSAGALAKAETERKNWMDFSDIEKILALVRDHELAEFELERDGLKVRVRKAGAPTFHAVAQPAPIAMPAHAPAALPAAAPVAAPAAARAEDAESLELAVVKSPIVGTFYRCPEPGAPSFVEVGQRVKKDQVLCIIEAMKLMNEITSEYDGEIVTAYVENGKPVQYGERLFAIKTS